jgi:peptidyl-tRNA hydrolase, PTH1 family
LPTVKLIVGLGNPGEQYKFSRHNLGFLSIDHLAGCCDFPSLKKGFDAVFAKGRIGSEAVIIAKPQTFMNLSGLSLEKLTAYFKVEINDIIIIHDDLDLPFQTVRLKNGGGHGGHKGLISIIQRLGSSDFLRVRAGIGKPARKGMVESYVMSPFVKEELEALPDVIAAAGDAAKEIVLSGIDAAMCSYNGRTFGEIKIME